MAKNTLGKIYLSILVLLDVANFFVTLQVLNISSNQLKLLPDSIGQLEKLCVLNIASNQLKALPDSIGNLKRLQCLNVHDNKHLKVLPASLARAASLREITLDSMRFIYPPEEIAVQGAFVIKQFLSQGEP
jgi:Leucine-rich repeat (LRR) protein